MADLVNLRAARKRRQRIEKERQAQENRARYGRTKAEREAEAIVRQRDAATLDGHLRDGNGAKDVAKDGNKR